MSTKALYWEWGRAGFTVTETDTHRGTLPRGKHLSPQPPSLSGDSVTSLIRVPQILSQKKGI